MDSNILYKFMAVFGDNKEHSYNEISTLGFFVCKKDAKVFKEIWGKIRNYWVKKTCYGEEKESNYQLTIDGDSWFRDMSIRRGGSSGYYRNVERTPESYNKYGDS